MNNGKKIGGTVCTVIGSLLFIIGNFSGFFFIGVVGAEYGGVGFLVGFAGFMMLLIGISMLIDQSKEKKWLEEINARNAQYGLVKPFYGNQPGQSMYGNYPQPEGAPRGSYDGPAVPPYHEAVQNPCQPNGNGINNQ